MKKKPLDLRKTEHHGNGRVNLATVAAHVGCSRMAASMALRNHPRISKTTREAVRRAATELGYRPDPGLSRLAARRSAGSNQSAGMPLALVTFRHPVSPARQTYDIDQVRDCSAPLGYALRHYECQEQGGATRLGDILYHQGIEAVLIDNCMEAQFAAQFPWERFCCVSIFSGYHELPVNHVDTDAFMEVVTAWRKIRATGARRINFVFFREAAPPVDRRWQLAAILHCRDEDPGVEHVDWIEIRSEELAKLDEWMKRTRPDVVVGFSLSVYWWLDSIGWHIPTHVGFVCFSLTEAIQDRPVSGLVRARAKVIRAAVDQLDLQVRRFERGIPELRKRIFVASEWIDGDSLPKRT